MLDDEFFDGLGDGDGLRSSQAEEPDMEVARPCYAFARKFSAELASKVSASFENLVL